MPNDTLFNEEYRFNPIPFLPDKKSIQLYATMEKGNATHSSILAWRIP